MKDALIGLSVFIIFSMVIIKSAQFFWWSSDYDDCQELASVVDKEAKLIGSHCTYVDDNGVLNRVFM